MSWRVDRNADGRDMRKRLSALAEFARRAWKSVRLLIDRYRITKAERTFLRSLDEATSRAAGGSPVVLIEAVEDHYYLVLFARIVAELQAAQAIEAHQFVPRSLRPGGTRSLVQAVKSLCFYNAVTDRKWIRLYAAFCSRVAYRSAARLFSRGCIEDLVQARRIWRNLESKEALIGLTITGIKVGDLINDSYLRFKPAATVDLKSTYLWLVIWQTLRDLRASRGYMFQVRPTIFVTSYSTYIQHGIAARVAMAAGVQVFTFGNYQEFYKRLTSVDWVHTRNPDNYRSGFARMENSAAKIVEAEKALSARVAGAIDPATAYMQRSAYGGSAVLPDGIAGSMVLFLHDFFDSPHCYRWMIFPDFWDWATFTLDLARHAGIRVFVKPHPNQIANSESVVRQLTALYPEATWLSTHTSNKQLADAGMGVAVTIYGSVAHEMAYLGIPSIAAGHNPHISFSISHTAHSREEYSRLLLNYQKLSRSPERLRRDSLEFYCMHNLADAPDMARLREALIRFRTLVVRKGGWLRDGADFLAFANELAESAAFRKACKELAAYLAHDPDDNLSKKFAANDRKQAAELER
jgi:hypothetical protein